MRCVCGLDRFWFQRGRKSGPASFVVRASDAAIPSPMGAPRVTVILGAEIADGLEGRCAAHAFAPLACRLNRTGKTLRCD